MVNFWLLVIVLMPLMIRRPINKCLIRTDPQIVNTWFSGFNLNGAIKLIYGYFQETFINQKHKVFK